MSDRDLPRRVVRTGVALALWFIFWFALGGRPDIAWGLAVGSALSLVSFASLAWLVTRAVSPSRPKTWLLGLAMLLKLPLYGVVLAYAFGSGRVSGLAVMAGVALVPTVIFLKALGRMWFGAAEKRSPD